MTKDQENKFSMFEGVSSVFKNNPEVTARIPAFEPAIGELNETMDQIKQKSIEVQNVLVGKTSEKQSAKDQLIESLFEVSAAIMAYARRTQNPVLVEKNKVTKSALQRMRDTLLVNRATAIHTNATEILQNLTEFGITETTLTELNNRITQFNTALGSREQSAASRTAARLALKGLFSRADEILKNDLDNLVALVKKDNLQFYNTYISARAIKHLGHRHRPDNEKPDGE